MEIEVLSAKRWTRTHAKFKAIAGASFCRFVDENDADAKADLSPKNAPTCIDCAYFIAEHRALTSGDWVALKAAAVLHRRAKYGGTR